MRFVFRRSLHHTSALRAAPKKTQTVAASNFVINILKDGKDPVG